VIHVSHPSPKFFYTLAGYDIKINILHFIRCVLDGAKIDDDPPIKTAKLTLNLIISCNEAAWQRGRRGAVEVGWRIETVLTGGSLQVITVPER
jgi:hypothetical protein